MPLNKTVTLDTGVAVTYWRETELNINGVTNKMWCNFQGYLDSTAYQTGKKPAAERVFTTDLPGSYLTMTTTQMVVAMRDYIKTQSEFSGATNAS
jgi:hypothetical protein